MSICYIVSAYGKTCIIYILLYLLTCWFSVFCFFFFAYIVKTIEVVVIP